MAENTGSRAILDSEHDECLAMLDRSFERTPNGYFNHYFKGDPWYKNEYCRVYPVDGRIISSVNICRREVRVGCSTLVLGGIGNVGTEPEFRGKGYSSEVLKDCVKVMDEEEMDFSLLYTGIHGFYERIGWRMLPTPFLFGALKHLENPVSDAYTVRPYEDYDASSLLSIYDAFNSELVMSAIRTEPYWRKFCMHECHPPWTILFAEADSSPVAYVISRIEKETTIVLDEMGVMPGHEAGLDVLIRRALCDAMKFGVTEARIEPATHPYVIAIADGVLEQLGIQYSTYGMVMFFDLQRTFARLLPELSRRAKAVRLMGSVQIETEIGSIALRSDGSQVAIADSAEVVVRLTQTDLARLIFGMEPAKDPESDVPSAAVEFLENLFPIRPFVYWQADMF